MGQNPTFGERGSTRQLQRWGAIAFNLVILGTGLDRLSNAPHACTVGKPPLPAFHDPDQVFGCKTVRVREMDAFPIGRTDLSKDGRSNRFRRVPTAPDPSAACAVAAAG
jgi:hypothetical protein